MKNILIINGNMHADGLRTLEDYRRRNQNLQIAYYEKAIGGVELREALQNAHGLIQRTATPIGAEEIKAAKNLRFIVRLGVGLDHIDLVSTKKAGINVHITVAENISSVAELTLGLMVGLTHRLHEADRSLKKDQWLKPNLVGHNLNNKTLGIIGLGRVGTAVTRRAQAFDMSVVAYDPYITSWDKTVSKCGSLEELLQRSDIVSLHVPLTHETKDMVDKRFLEQMRPQSWLINTARGEVVDEQALIDALNSGHVAGAGLDVFCNEPSPRADLVGHPKVLASPHIGGATHEAQSSIAIEAAKIALAEFSDFRHSGPDLDAGLANLGKAMPDRGFSCQ